MTRPFFIGPDKIRAFAARFTMTAAESTHLNRNGFRTDKDEEFVGGRGTNNLIKQTVIWVRDDLGLEEEEWKAITWSFPNVKGSLDFLPDGGPEDDA